MLPIDSGHVNVGIQIAGNDKHKHWPISNYVALINDLHERFHKVNIYIMDSPSKNFPSSGYDNSRVYNLIGKTSIAANINLIQKMDVWISPDSFSKYVAHWASVPQLIFCCKLPYIDPARMVKSCFNEVGIFHDSIIQVVGIDFDSAGEISSCYDDIALIPYAKVWDSVVSLLNSIDKLK